MISVLIADDHTLLREGLKRILAEAPDMEVVAEAATGEEAIEKAHAARPSVVLLDIGMPGRGGLETLKELKRWSAKIKVLVLSVNPEDQLALRFLREGADGYLTKASAPEQLLGALRKIAGGGKFLSPLLAERLAASLSPDFEKPAHERLSSRELQVMVQIAAGKTVKEIADVMHLSVKTVSTYRARILEKMQLRNNADIMRYALLNGLGEATERPAFASP